MAVIRRRIEIWFVGGKEDTRGTSYGSWGIWCCCWSSTGLRDVTHQPRDSETCFPRSQYDGVVYYRRTADFSEIIVADEGSDSTNAPMLDLASTSKDRGGQGQK